MFETLKYIYLNFKGFWNEIESIFLHDNSLKANESFWLVCFANKFVIHLCSELVGNTKIYLSQFQQKFLWIYVFENTNKFWNYLWFWLGKTNETVVRIFLSTKGIKITNKFWMYFRFLIRWNIHSWMKQSFECFFLIKWLK